MKQPILSVMHSHLIAYPTASNLNLSWNYGSLAGLVLVAQIVTGVFLAMHYTCHVDMAFASVQHIMFDINNGWLIRYMHANGASLFFIVVYLHMFRSLYYSSYASPREAVWLIGVVILLVMIVTAFIGYVLPFAQLSLWGSTVITSLASAIPVVGESITAWLWGGFTVANPTLNRFYSLHFLLPFILAALSVVHLAALHQHGSSNPLGVNVSVDKIPFYPYYSSKDLMGVIFLGIGASLLVFYYPDILSHPDNQIPANPYQTPSHIVPEWYYLWVYAILRSIPDKLLGVCAILFVFVTLAALPFYHIPGTRSPLFRPIHEVLFFTFLADCVILTAIGSKPVESPYLEIGQLATAYFFFYFWVLLPLTAYLEKKLIVSFSNESRNNLVLSH